MANDTDKHGARVGNVLLSACVGLLLLGVGAAFSVTSRLASLEEKVAGLADRFDGYDKRLDKFETRMERDGK